MNLETEKDILVRRYLLDEMSDKEQIRIEEKFLEDDNFLEEIAALEDELYYDYKQNRLSQIERVTFEKKLLATSQDNEKAGFAEAFLKATAEISAEKTAPNLWQSIAAFFSFSNATFKFGTAAVSLLLLSIFGFWILNNSNRQIDDLAIGVPETIDTLTPTPTPVTEKVVEEKQKSEQNTNKIKELEKQITPPAQPLRTFVALILSPGLVRDGSGKTPKIKLTPEIKTINLTLVIKKGIEAESVTIIVRNVDGGQISNSSAKLGTRKSLSFAVSSKNLKRGDYEVVLINSADNEELESYYFSIEK